jgi:hypothetical protein
VSNAALGKGLLLAATSAEPDAAALAVLSSQHELAHEPSSRLGICQSKLDKGVITREEFDDILKHDATFMADQDLMRHSASNAVLEVILFSASGLPRMDAFKLPGQGCDPFVRITADGASVLPEMSTVKTYTQNPVWGTGEPFRITFAPGEPLPAAVEVAVFDRDTFSKDDYIGRAVITVPTDAGTGGTQVRPIIGLDGAGGSKADRLLGKCDLGHVRVSIGWMVDGV